MALKTYDKREDVPEAQRTAAIETVEHKFIVEEPADPALGEAGRKALDAERARADTAEAAHKTEKKRADDLKRASDARAQGISEEALQKIRDDEAAARKPILDENTALKTRVRQLTLTDRVQKLALEAGIMADRIKQAMKLLADRTDLSDADGIVVLDEAGKVTAETITDFLAKTFKAENPFLYKGTNAAGSGAQGTQGGGGEPAPVPDPAQLDAKRVAVKTAF